MKIVHICLAASYVEGFGYQENILTEMHVQMGHEVTVLTSDYVFNSKKETVLREEKDYINAQGVHVRALKKITDKGYYRSRMLDFIGLYDALCQERPDVIFVHGGQFIALRDVIKYCKTNKQVKLYVDQHADYYNSPLATAKLWVLQKVIFGHWMRKAVPYTEKYWGVTPWRCQYLHEVYGIPKEKIGLLVMGGDDRHIHFDQLPQLRTDIRSQLDLNYDDFVVITGGKIDSTKNIHLLMQAIIELDRDKLKLIVFGQPNDEMQPLIDKLSADKHIRNIGWLDSTKVYDYFLSSDLAVFPGTHSVLWEQACACGIPGLFKDWEGMHHVNVDGSAEFLRQDSKDEIKAQLLNLYEDKDKYKKMAEAAWNQARYEFSYKEIAKRAIQTEDSI